MKKILTQISLVFVLLSNGDYVNTDYIQYINTKSKYVEYLTYFRGFKSNGFVDVTEKDIQNIISVMNTDMSKK
jgi:hypothetical protein